MEIPESKPAGYQWLAERFDVVAMPHWRETRILVRGTRRLVETDGRQVEYLPAALIVLSFRRCPTPGLEL